MATPWIAFASISTWLLLLQVGQPGLKEKSGQKPNQQKANVAQQQSSESQRSNTESQNEHPEAPITAKAGKYVIKVTKTDAIDQMKLGRKPSSHGAVNMLLEQLQNGSTQNSSNNLQSNNQFFGGNGNGSGSSGGVSGGLRSRDQVHYCPSNREDGKASVLSI